MVGDGTKPKTTEVKNIGEYSKKLIKIQRQTQKMLYQHYDGLDSSIIDRYQHNSNALGTTELWPWYKTQHHDQRNKRQITKETFKL